MGIARPYSLRRTMGRGSGGHTGDRSALHVYCSVPPETLLRAPEHRINIPIGFVRRGRPAINDELGMPRQPQQQPRPERRMDPRGLYLQAVTFLRVVGPPLVSSMPHDASLAANDVTMPPTLIAGCLSPRKCGWNGFGNVFPARHPVDAHRSINRPAPLVAADRHEFARSQCPALAVGAGCGQL